jgi:hypothetical protein
MYTSKPKISKGEFGDYLPDYNHTPNAPKPSEIQVGGGHYSKYKIQPTEFIHANGVPFIEGNVIKYVMRHRQKNGIEDLKKARHYIDLLIQFEYENAKELE